MASESFQYRALFEYRKEHGDDLSLHPGDLLTVPKALLMSAAGLENQEGDERSPAGWLHGVNERSKEKGNFPGTFVEYVGTVMTCHPGGKSCPQPAPLTPKNPLGILQPPRASAASRQPVQSRKIVLGKIGAVCPL
ncbi:hypothetical protein GOODEAATRI_020954 [Goodea atripinnis]|uniref:SH3 domain-containing protein n=1 Tax=Goodea atripinnis TaxID=208336 RepID=A0ABV0PQR5_9TELE